MLLALSHLLSWNHERLPAGDGFYRPALQIFDKALTEVTFTELYAELCVRLSAKLPAFEDPDAAPPEDGQPAKKSITFRRWVSRLILLSACQLLAVCSIRLVSASCPHWVDLVCIRRHMNSKLQEHQMQVAMH